MKPRIAFRSLPALFAALIAFSSCAPAQPAPAVVPTPSACSLDDVLPLVDNVLQGHQYEADYLTINHQLALSIWLVDPNIDLAASAGIVEANTGHAFRTGARLAYQLAAEIPCVRVLFDAINPMIVDRQFNGWYIDIIPIRAIPNTEQATDDELAAAIQQTGLSIAYLRRVPPRPPPRAATTESCTWSEARSSIQLLFGEDRRNVSAYLIGGYQAVEGSPDAEPIYAQVQWDIQSAGDAQEGPVLEMLASITRLLICLNPAVDRLETYVVDSQGRVVVYALIPHTVIAAQEFPLDPNQFTLIYFESPQ